MLSLLVYLQDSIIKVRVPSVLEDMQVIQFKGVLVLQSVNMPVTQTQSVNSIAIGSNAGNDTQSNDSIAIGRIAGQIRQLGFSVAIGQGAGAVDQQTNAVAIVQVLGVIRKVVIASLLVALLDRLVRVEAVLLLFKAQVTKIKNTMLSPLASLPENRHK